MHAAAPRTRLAAVAAALMLVGAGCGGEDVTPTTTTATTTTATTTTGTTTTTTATPTTATAPAPPPTDVKAIADGPTGAVADAEFVADMGRLNTVLTGFATTLQQASAGQDALRARVDDLRGALTVMTAYGTRMGRYTVPSPRLEARRAAVVSAIPAVVSTGDALLNAASDADAADTRTAAAPFLTALKRLQAAAGT